MPERGDRIVGGIHDGDLIVHAARDGDALQRLAAIEPQQVYAVVVDREIIERLKNNIARRQHNLGAAHALIAGSDIASICAMK